MPEIRDNYGSLLSEQVDEARLAGNLRALRQRQGAQRVRRARVAASALTAFVCAIGSAFYVRLSATTPGAVQITSREAERCLSRDGAVCDEALVPFGDGSRVSLDRDTRLQLLENDGQRVRTVLHQGWARFSVEPGGPRRWVVELGELEVEVIGTAFSLLKRGALARVEVHHGRVLVRGASVPGGSALLTAGQSFSTGERERPATTTATIRAAEPAPASSVPAPVAVTPRRRSPAQAQSHTADSAPHDVAERALVAADRLRLAGDPRAGHEVLAQALLADAHGPHSGLVAFTLAQLSLDALAAPARAAHEFDQALESGSLSRSLREQALARRVEALARAGKRDDARAARERYLAAYPGGRWVREMARWAATE